jgi:hypothetical protein
MNTMIRKEAARLWYALKIAAGTGPDAGERPEAAKPARSDNADRDPALVVLSRAGRSNVQAQQRSQGNEGIRPAYALPYNPHPIPQSVAPRVAETLVGGDAGIVV